VGAVLGAGMLLGASWGRSEFSPVGTAANESNVIPDVGFPPYVLGANEVSPIITVGNALLYETVGTMVLVLSVFSSAVDRRSFAAANLVPFPIGFTVWIVHLSLIPFTGCGINPARTFGPALVNTMAGVNTWGTSWWVYYVGPVFGSILAVLAQCIMWGGRDPPNPRAEVAARERREESRKEPAPRETV